MIPSNLLTARFNSNHITSSWSLGCVMLCHHISSSWFSKFFVHVAATKTLHDPPECQTFWNRCVSRCHLTSPNDTCETIDETSRSAFRIFSGSFSGQELDPFGQVYGSSESTSQHLHLCGFSAKALLWWLPASAALYFKPQHWICEVKLSRVSWTS